MKILHLSDLHFGKSPFKKDIYEYQLKFCEYTADFIKQKDIGAVLIAGDIYDTSVAAAAAVGLWDRFAAMLINECKVPVFVISGNHDGAERLSVCSDILSSAGLHIRGSLDDCDVPVTVGDCCIYMLPFFEKGHAENRLGRKFASVSEAYEALTEEIRQKLDSTKRNIIMAHCFALGGVPSESETAYDVMFSEDSANSVGTLNAVSAECFRGFDYAALGHIHRPQTLKCSSDDVIIRYSGTPLKYSFSEVSQEKSFSVYDSEKNSLEIVDLPEFLKLGISKGSAEEIKLACGKYRDCQFVRIEITDEESDVSVAELRELYPKAVQIVSAARKAVRAKTSAITDAEIARMDMIALAEKYLKEYYGGMEMTDEQRQWLKEAAAEEEEI